MKAWCTLEYFTLYLRNRQSGNSRAIESCVCSIRSIERNMKSFYGQYKWNWSFLGGFVGLVVQVNGIFYPALAALVSPVHPPPPPIAQ